MICKEDCIAFAGLTAEEEIDAIAEHEHLGEIGAAALADYLVDLEMCRADRHMMVDDICDALIHGRTAHAAELTTALRHFG